LRMRTYDGKQTAQQDLDVLFDMFNLERLPPTPPPAHQLTPISPEQHALQQARPATHEIVYDDQLVYDKATAPGST
uniref:Integrase n=1 Tax=Heligmosomoides polygyrus TaxID=6339 RepID=A0A183FAV0_HELPZ